MPALSRVMANTPGITEDLSAKETELPPSLFPLLQ